MALVLASASPRRQELLGRLGIEVVVAPADVDETPLPSEDPAGFAVRIAAAKADTIARAFPDLPVLAADTVVTDGIAILGKPLDRADAEEMLHCLAGRSHLVITAMAARFRGLRASEIAISRVTFAPWNAGLAAWYLATGEWADKAGGYAVQGRAAVLVERVDGNVQAVVGLPLARVPGLLARVGIRLVPDGDRLTLEPTGD